MWSKVEVVGGGGGGRTQAKLFLRKLMSPLVEESWEWTSAVSLSSGSIFFASCLPSSTLIKQRGRRADTSRREKLGSVMRMLEGHTKGLVPATLTLGLFNRMFFFPDHDFQVEEQDCTKIEE